MGNHHAEEQIEDYYNKLKEESQSRTNIWNSLSSVEQIEELEQRLKLCDSVLTIMYQKVNYSSYLNDLSKDINELLKWTKNWKD